MSKYIKLEDIKWHSPDESIANPLTEFYVTESDIANLPTIEVSEDCISREQVRAKLDYISYAEKDPITIAKRIVDNAPSVTTEQSSKVGEWKRHPIHENRAWDICTACGIGCRRRHYGFNADGTEWVEEENYPFCPNCGAKMKGADNERDN